eukprot:gb/GECH01013991.1/.p1 GENE.gb/GECH01013991.1/~~gb/GECH01013991.1/.p1  ORF type:complete len:850 (+),score=291.61 gb/GECH01013991.1/:1-2550(+)
MSAKYQQPNQQISQISQERDQYAEELSKTRNTLEIVVDEVYVTQEELEQAKNTISRKDQELNASRKAAQELSRAFEALGAYSHELEQVLSSTPSKEFLREMKQSALKSAQQAATYLQEDYTYPLSRIIQSLDHQRSKEIHQEDKPQRTLVKRRLRLVSSILEDVFTEIANNRESDNKKMEETTQSDNMKDSAIEEKVNEHENKLNTSNRKISQLEETLNQYMTKLENLNLDELSDSKSFSGVNEFISNHAEMSSGKFEEDTSSTQVSPEATISNNIPNLGTKDGKESNLTDDSKGSNTENVEIQTPTPEMSEQGSNTENTQIQVNQETSSSSHLEMKIKTLQNSLEESRNRCSDFENRVHDLEQKNEKLKDNQQGNSNKRIIEELEEKVSNLEEERDELENRVSNLQESLQEQQMQHKDDVGKVRMEMEKHIWQADVDSEKGTQDQFKEYQQEIDQLSNEVNNLSEQLDNANEKRLEYERTIDQYHADLKDAISENRKKEKKLENSNQEIEKLKKSIHGLRREVSAASESNKSYQNRNIRGREDSDSITMREKYNKLKSLYHQTKKELRSLKNSYSASQAAHKATNDLIGDYQTENKKLLDSSKENNNTQDQPETVASMLQQITSLSEQNKLLFEEKMELKRKIKAQIVEKTSSGSINDGSTTIHKELDALSKKYNDLLQDNTRLIEMVAHAEEKSRVAKKQLESAQKSFQSKESELNSRLWIAERHVSTLTAQLNHLKSENDNLSNLKYQLEKESENLVDSMQDKQKHSSKNDGVDSNNDQSSFLDLMDSIDQLKEEKEELQEQIEKLQNQNDEMLYLLDEKHEMVTSLMQEKSNLEQDQTSNQSITS